VRNVIPKNLDLRRKWGNSVIGNSTANFKWGNRGPWNEAKRGSVMRDMNVSFSTESESEMHQDVSPVQILFPTFSITFCET